MRELTYVIGVTLDGFIAGPADEVDFFEVSEDFAAWLATEWADTLPTHVREALGAADAPLTKFDSVVMGRRTYEPALEADIVDPYRHLNTVVCSSTIKAPAGSSVRITADAPGDVVSQLKRSGDSDLDILLAGGGQLAGQLAGQIDRLVVKKYPVVAGRGVPMFDRAFEPLGFSLQSTRAFTNGCTVLEFVRGGSGN